MKIETNLDVDQKVFIKNLDVGGRIAEISIDRAGTQYKVRYFDNATINFGYFYEDELEKR